MLRRAQPARLLASDRTQSGTRLLLLGRGQTWVGRGRGAALAIADSGVADRHALIICRRGRYYIRTFRFAGPTFVNDLQVRRWVALEHGDLVRFGAAAYRFIDPDYSLRRAHRRIAQATVAAAMLLATAFAHGRGWDVRMIDFARRNAPAGWQPPAAEPGNNTRLVRADAPPVSVPPAALPTPRPAPRSADAVRPVAARSGPSPAQPQASPMPDARDIWIQRINFFRTMAGLDPIRENRELSASVDAHARYLMVNFGDRLRSEGSIGNAAYREERSRAGYSEAGDLAAANSQIAWGCGTWDPTEQIDRWIAGPFHRLEILDPLLKEAGFGESERDGCWVAALRLPPQPEAAGLYARPVMFPPNGSTVSLHFAGGEFPDPLAACPGYSIPIGLPITLETGRLVESGSLSVRLAEEGRAMEHCAFDARGYRNSSRDAQEYARWAMRSHGSVIIIPRAPLRPGTRYEVSVAIGSQAYAWSFQTPGQ